MFVNRMPRYEILSEEALDVLDGGWRRIVSKLGVELLHPEALEHFRRAGQTVEGRVVRLDPEFVLEQVARAPAEFGLRGRNPARSVRIGGDHMAFCCVQGPPFVREGDVRRAATLADFERFCRLSQAFDEIDTAGGIPCEPRELPVESGHLDMQLALQALTDKPYMGSQISGIAARDSLELAAILFGGREELEREPVLFSTINVNSPLRYDERMLAALLEYAAWGQPVVITPFLLMGAMSPVSIPAALAQQTAEQLVGVALAQLVRPGAPVVLGSFLSHTDLKSGSPGFGGPESALGLLCSGQIARRLGLPWRSGGGSLTSSQTCDAQAAYEGLNTMTAAFLAGANFVFHTAGWLESGLVACYEKFVLDIELVRMLRAQFSPLQIDEASLAFGAHAEVRHGGHFLEPDHPRAGSRYCFTPPLLPSPQNNARGQRGGAEETADRAAALWRSAVERYEQPPLDGALREQLGAFAARRRAELQGS